MVSVIKKNLPDMEMSIWVADVVTLLVHPDLPVQRFTLWPQDFSWCLPGYWHSQYESHPQMGRNALASSGRNSAGACAQDMGQTAMLCQQTHGGKLMSRAVGSVRVLPCYITNWSQMTLFYQALSNGAAVSALGSLWHKPVCCYNKMLIFWTIRYSPP